MKKYLLKIIFIFIFILIGIIIYPTQVKATENYIEKVNLQKEIIIADADPGTGGGGGSTESGTNSGIINTDNYKPEITNNTRANSIISKVFGVLQIVGGIAIVISIALLGLNNILGSAGEKAQGQGRSIGILIGAIMIFGVSTVAKFILSVVE